MMNTILILDIFYLVIDYGNCWNLALFAVCFAHARTRDSQQLSFLSTPWWKNSELEDALVIIAVVYIPFDLNLSNVYLIQISSIER